ncbi:MAG: dihydrofolate reductase family protein [Planctomycetota bacterium]
MRRLAVLTFLTVDGVMQAPSSPDEDTSNGFSQGGWARRYWDEVMQQVMREAMSEPYDLLLGRRTYDSFAGAFAEADEEANPVAKKLNDARKFVVTSDPSSLSWANSHAIVGDIASEVSRLKTQEGPLLQVHGSCRLIQLLLSHRLIDEFRLWTFPVLAGAGKRLFENGTTPATLELLKQESLECGATMSFYRQPQGSTER